jgi:hypothetical protein
MLIGVFAGAGLNLFMGWMDKPQAMIGIIASTLCYLIAFVTARDLARWVAKPRSAGRRN